MAVIEQLNQMIEPAIKAVGFEFVGLEFIAQGRQSILRVFIDSENGITVDNCAKVSRQISAILDVEDPISGHYSLEVSSPGLERPLFKLKHFEDYVGNLVKLRCHAPVDGRRNFKGSLVSVDGEQLHMLVDNEEFVVEFGNVEKANIVPDYDDLG